MRVMELVMLLRRLAHKGQWEMKEHDRLLYNCMYRMPNGGSRYIVIKNAQYNCNISFVGAAVV